MRDVRAGSRPPARNLALAGLVLTLAACAGAPHGPMGGRPGGGPGGGGGPALFVSPFGELFTAAPGAPWPVADWFAGADADGDGSLTFEEFAADGRRWFNHVDNDHSGRIDQAELAIYETSLHGFSGGMRRGGGGPPSADRPGGAGPGDIGGADLAEPQSRGGGRGHGGGGRGGRGGGGGRQMGYGRIAEAGFFDYPEPVKAADVNVDQRITTDEWTQATQRWFQALDMDHDGRLTLATLPKTPLQARVEASRPDRGGHDRP